MRQSNIDLVNRVLAEQSADQPIYDIGGGSYKSMWSFPVVTVDISGETNILADATDMCIIPDEVAGTVITTDTFEHINHPFKAIDEIHRILKKDGLLVLSTVLLWDYHEYPHDYFRFTVEGLEYLCRNFKKIESGWQEENAPIDGNNIKVVAPHAGVYFVGRKI